MELSPLPLWVIFAIFIAAALAIAFAGTRLAYVADKLADHTGMGEIVAGAVFVGGSTSLPGMISSVSTAADGYAGLSIGNALGGVTVQTAFLAVADLIYRKANLEHAGATATGLAQGVLLVTMLTIPLLAYAAPEFSLGWIHPVSFLIFLVYGFGIRLLVNIRETPMWKPVETPDTLKEISEVKTMAGDLKRLWLRFTLYAAITAVAGYVIGEASIAITNKTLLSETTVGTIFTAISNSLPELVTAIAAVRAGAVNLAIGDIVGGNSFEVLFIATSDLFFTRGSIYHAFDNDNLFTTAMAILMTGVLLLGLLRRERYGVGKIGFESALVLVLYATSVAMLFI